MNLLALVGFRDSWLWRPLWGRAPRLHPPPKHRAVDRRRERGRERQEKYKHPRLYERMPWPASRYADLWKVYRAEVTRRPVA